ncbi:MAG: hypothetical protein ACYTXY_05265 [Nostoc sp.]
MRISKTLDLDIDMNTSTYIFTNNNLSALLKDLSSEEEHQILGGAKISHKPVCKSKLKIEGIKVTGGNIVGLEEGSGGTGSGLGIIQIF